MPATPGGQAGSPTPTCLEAAHRGARPVDRPRPDGEAVEAPQGGIRLRLRVRLVAQVVDEVELRLEERPQAEADQADPLARGLVRPAGVPDRAVEHEDRAGGRRDADLLLVAGQA